jgi:CheY-like chemotaxis protein
VAKILVADDNSNIQKMVGLALKDQGIDVVAVGNGEAAVRKISDVRPDLVLADVFMPVRNGYEVCRYVKEDSSLAHIPVILLVGAFDPLDEQEAQRVGADGVLKKPFVPPDPLISMVKSALTRAGVSIGPASTEKAPPPPKRSTADILGGGSGPKMVPPAPLPEVSPEPLEEFAAPTAQPHLKIAAGSEPLAFGSLLDTSDAEDLAITAKPMIELAKASKWEDDSDEVKEEEEESEESSGSVWRPGGIDETIERAAQTSEAAPDWRDEAFHGSSPAGGFSSKPWNPSEPQPSFAEAAESHTVAVATVEHKPAVDSTPFAGDAWAAAMAAGVEEKIAEIKEAAPAEPQAPEVQQETRQQPAPAAETFASAQETVQSVPAPAAQPAPVEQPSEPANWAAAPATAWEMEAKKASQLASTWDSPKAFAVDETQEVPAYSSESAVEEHAHPSAPEAPAEQSAYSAEPIVEHEPEQQAETPASAAPEAPAASHEPEPEPKSLHASWEVAPAAAPAEPEPVIEHAPAQAAEVEHSPAASTSQFVEEPVAQEPVAEQKAPEPVAESKPAEPDMDELVARVLGKMNPDVLQKVTREILKPVIEAIVRDEINSKKS